MQMKTIEELFSQDSSRADWLTLDACGIHADFSRQRIDKPMWDELLQELAGVDVAGVFERAQVELDLGVLAEREAVGVVAVLAAHHVVS